MNILLDFTDALLARYFYPFLSESEVTNFFASKNERHNGRRCLLPKVAPPPGPGMLSVNDYADVACVLEFGTTGSLPSHAFDAAPMGCVYDVVL